jgi:hypothetical protein
LGYFVWKITILRQKIIFFSQTPWLEIRDPPLGSSLHNRPRVDMSIHSDTLSWFRPNQLMLFLLNDVCLAKKQHIPILYSLVWHDRGSNPRSTELDASTVTMTPPMRFLLNYLNYIIFTFETFAVSDSRALYTTALPTVFIVVVLPFWISCFEFLYDVLALKLPSNPKPDA